MQNAYPACFFLRDEHERQLALVVERLVDAPGSVIEKRWIIDSLRHPWPCSRLAATMHHPAVETPRQEILAVQGRG